MVMALLRVTINYYKKKILSFCMLGGGICYVGSSGCVKSGLCGPTLVHHNNHNNHHHHNHHHPHHTTTVIIILLTPSPLHSLQQLYNYCNFLPYKGCYHHCNHQYAITNNPPPPPPSPLPQTWYTSKVCAKIMLSKKVPKLRQK